MKTEEIEAIFDHLEITENIMIKILNGRIKNKRLRDVLFHIEGLQGFRHAFSNICYLLDYEGKVHKELYKRSSTTHMALERFHFNDLEIEEQPLIDLTQQLLRRRDEREKAKNKHEN